MFQLSNHNSTLFTYYAETKEHNYEAVTTIYIKCYWRCSEDLIKEEQKGSSSIENIMQTALLELHFWNSSITLDSIPLGWLDTVNIPADVVTDVPADVVMNVPVGIVNDVSVDVVTEIPVAIVTIIFL